jgi:cobalt/nickel transport system permease protein
VLTLVLLVQGFVFGDGGITTMGANILNMGVISGFVGYYTYSALRRNVSVSIAAFGGAWLGLFISAIACAIQMWLAGNFPLVPGLITMGTYHLIIGFVGEGLLTSVAITAIAKSRPDLLDDSLDARKARVEEALA